MVEHDDDIGVSGSNKVFKSLEDEEVRAEDQVSGVKRRRTCQLGYEQREREQLIPAGKIKDKAATLQISSLPRDVLYCILDKLLELVDYVRFAAACKQLQTEAKQYNLYRQRWLRKPQLLPMLMLPLDESDNDSSSEPQTKQRLLYSVSERKIYRNINLGLSVSYNERLCGSSQGWLASTLKSTKELADKRLEVKYEITLRNPFGKSSEVIHLPPYKHCFYRGYNLLAEWIPRIILSGDPDLHPENFYVLFALYRPLPSITTRYYSPPLALIRGQESWITINHWKKVDDAIFYKNKVCLLINERRYLLTLDVDTNYLSQQEIRYLRFEPEPEPDYRSFIFCWERYLVESTNGDLLLVRRCYKCRETSFVISKIVFNEENDSSSKTVQLVDIQSIGDDAIFLGQSQSQSVLASSIPGCKPNCIYYATESIVRDEILLTKNGCISDMGIFNLGDGTKTPLMNSDSIDNWNWNKMNMPFWILPSLNSALDS